MGKAILARKTISIVAACALALGLTPLPAFAAGAGEADGAAAASALAAPQRSDAQIDAAVDAMLSAGVYEEGEAVVCLVGELDAGLGGGLAAQAATDDLLAGAESLSAVTASQYAEATGEILLAAEAVPGGLSTQAAQEPVRIALVHKDEMSTADLLKELLCDPRVLSAEPNYIMSFASDDADDAADAADAAVGKEAAQAALGLSTGLTGQDADDPIAASADLTGYQWFSQGAANSIPQYVDGTNPGVQSPDWNDPAKTNSSGVVVIMDSGVDYTHPDLAGVMYHFSPELQAQLGCGEFGYAPAREDKTDPMDGLHHGTHCAGIVAAEWNDFGVSGIANGAKICAVSISQSLTNSNYTYSGIIKAYDFVIRAAQAGVDIRAINRSLSGSPINNANQAMIQAAGEAGVITCVASGNASEDLDAAYDDTSVIQSSPYILRVDAAKVQDDRAGFSNIGRYTTDVFAPGTDILSTVPSNKEEESRYYPQADSDPIYLETSFDGALLDVIADPEGTKDEQDTSLPNVQINGVSRGTVGSDGDGASLKLDLTVPVETPSVFYVDVPVGSLNKDEIQDIGVALYGGNGDVALRGGSYSRVSVLLEDGSFLRSGADIDFFGSPGGWSYGTIHISDPAALTQDFKWIEDSQGRKCIRLRVAPQIEVKDVHDPQTAQIELYLDQISIGKRGNTGFLPYQYMNGTSMATPVVAGCVAVVSSGITGVSPDVRAAQTACKIKGAVHQAQGYADLCKQNGQVDLSLLTSADGLVPVIESAQVVGANLTLHGAYFGKQGSVAIGGVEANVISWSDSSIMVQWPASITSGLVPIAVKTAAGAEACRAFILSAPETAKDGAVPYERDLAPMSLRADGASIMDVPQSLAASDDGVLFAAAANSDDRDDATVGSILRSDDKAASWMSVPLPQELKNVSLTIGDGTVFIWGATPADDPVAIEGWYLYGLDIATNEVKLLHDRYTVPFDDLDPDATDVNDIGQIAYANGNLFFVFAKDDDFEVENPRARMSLQLFDADYNLGECVTLKRAYAAYSFLYGPKVAAAGNSIYICGLITEKDRSEAGEHRGLQRVDVDADGNVACVDLSAAVENLSGDFSPDDICMAAGEQGVFLIGDGLAGLLPKGTQAIATDTYLLAPGATTFEAYPKTFSYAPVLRPKAVVAGDLLIAYGISKYETTSVFGRSTQLPAVPIDISAAAMTAGKATFTGKPLTPKVTVALDGKTLAVGTDYELHYANNVNAGTGVAIAVGKGAYSGVATKTFTIVKARNAIAAKAKKSLFTVSAKTLAKKNVAIARSKAISVSKATGKVAYKLGSVSKKAKGKVAVSSAGKITLKKGLGKGTYTVKVRVTAAGNANVKPKTVTVALKIRLK